MADDNPPVPAQRTSRRRRYPALRDQRRVLWEIPVPRSSSRVRVRVNVDPSSSESEEERFEAGGPSNVPRVRQSGPGGPSNVGPIVAQQGSGERSGPSHVGRRVGQRGSIVRSGPSNIGSRMGQQWSGEPRGPINAGPIAGNQGPGSSNVGPIVGHQGPGPSNVGSSAGQTSSPRTGLTIGCRPGSSSIDPLIGRSFSGVIGPSLDGVYHLTLRVAGSPDKYSGVLFLPGTFNPFTFKFDQEFSAPPDRESADPAEAKSPLVGGAINWPALNVGGPITGDDIASEKALKQAASRLTKIPDNVKITTDLLSDVIGRVQNNSASRQEPIKVDFTPTPAIAAAAIVHELQEVEKQVEEALAIGVKVAAPVPVPDNNVIIVDSDDESAS